MAGHTDRIFERKDSPVISVYVEPMASHSSVLSVESITPMEYAGAVPRDEGTNTDDAAPPRASLPAPSRVGQTINHAMARYENLLRRLAD